MASNNNEDFKPKLGRIRSLGGLRSKSYLNRVLHEISSVERTGFGTQPSQRNFTGYRIGRGGGTLARGQARFRSRHSMRRVVIKTRITKLRGGGLEAAGAHIRYIQRGSVSQENEPVKLYDAETDEANGKRFLERCDGDRHQFRFIVSAEDATELQDLKPFVRDLMAGMEKDLGTRLDWVAINHFNTEHPHTHIVLRGKDELGKDLVIARDYISYGMRQRACELLTLELGPQTEQEIRRKLERQVEQNRFTVLDRALVRTAIDHVVDLQSMPRGQDQGYRRALETGRLRVLAKQGLALELAPGRWQLSSGLEKTLRRAGERGDIIKTMHRGLKRAGLEVGLGEYHVYDPADPKSPTVIGQVIERGLHNELEDVHYVLVDGTDGRVHYVALDRNQNMEDIPQGAIVEVLPTSAGVKPSDRTIADVAGINDGLYTAEAHHVYDPQASTNFVQAHIRRLEALRRQNILQRFADGSWEVPDDFLDRVARTSASRSRLPGKVATQSYFSLDAQTNASGATWLDRQLVAKDPIPLRGARFGRDVTEALRRRQEQLVARGLAQRDGQVIRYQRNLLQRLRDTELMEAGEKLSTELGTRFSEAKDGDRIEGVYRRSVRLASGKFAAVENSKEFTLVPWRSFLEKRRGELVRGVMRGSTVSFDFSRKRSIGIT